MSVEKVLLGWQDYEEKKIKNDTDPKYFLSDESWEIHYLKSKIRNEYPQFDDLMVFEAIEVCSRKDPRPRREFVLNVLEQLGIG